MKLERCGLLSSRRAEALCWEGGQVLTFSLPAPPLPEGAPRRMRRYYQAAESLWRARWTGPLYRQACQAARQAAAEGRAFRPWTAELSYRITLEEEGRFGLLAEAREQTGGPRIRRRLQGETWSLPGGWPLTLWECFPGKRRQVLEQVKEQIRRRLASGESCFYPDWERRLSRAFRPERFFCSPEGPAVYFPLCSIAPYAEGIPIFPLSPVSQDTPGGGR